MEEIPDLYLKFAALRDAPDLQDAMLRFANHYGWLGLWGPLHYPDLKEQVLFRGEALSTWEEEIGTLATILELWEGVKVDDLGRLRTYVYWRNDNRSVELVIDIPKAQLDERVKKIVRRQQAKLLGRISKGNFIPSYRLLANVVNTEVEWFQKQRPGDLIEPAKLAICKIVNEKLTGKCSPRVLLEDDGSIGRYLTPNSLLAAMWLQTRDLVTGRKRFVECERCGRRLDTTKGRSTKKMCQRCSQYGRTKRWREKTREKKQHAKKKTRKP